MNPRSFAPWAATCVALLAPAVCFGSVFIMDEFTGDLGLVILTSGGQGFNGTYTGAGRVVSPGLTYPNLRTAGNAFQTAGRDNGALRALSNPIGTGGTVYVGFLAAATQGTVPDYAGVWLMNVGLVNNIFLGKPSQSDGYGFEVRGIEGWKQTLAGAPVSTTPSLLVYRFTFTDHGDTIDFFADPTPGRPLPATPTLTFAIPEGKLPQDFSSIQLVSGGGAGTGTPFLFDELRVGSSFADVAPVPEPTALGLLCVVAPLALRRRR